MDALTLFGLFAVSAMLVCYAFENQSHWFVLLFAASCALGSAYGFLQGAWPFGLVKPSGRSSPFAAGVRREFPEFSTQNGRKSTLRLFRFSQGTPNIASRKQTSRTRAERRCGIVQ